MLNQERQKMKKLIIRNILVVVIVIFSIIGIVKYIEIVKHAEYECPTIVNPVVVQSEKRLEKLKELEEPQKLSQEEAWRMKRNLLVDKYLKDKEEVIPFYEIITIRKDSRGKIITHIYIYTTSCDKESFLCIGKNVRQKLGFTNYKILFYNDRQQTPKQIGPMTDKQMECWMGNFRTNERDGSYNPVVIMTDLGEELVKAKEK